MVIIAKYGAANYDNYYNVWTSVFNYFVFHNLELIYEIFIMLFTVQTLEIIIM